MVDVEALRASFGVARVLDAYGVKHRGSRSACPVCARRNPQAFAFGGKGRGWLWQCFACGAKGDAVDLLSTLAGISKGQALREAARMVGLADGDPTEIAARASAAIAVARERDANERASASLRNLRLDFAHRCYRDRDTLIRVAYRLRDPDALASAYDRELEGMIAEAQADEMPVPGEEPIDHAFEKERRAEWAAWAARQANRFAPPAPR